MYLNSVLDSIGTENGSRGWVAAVMGAFGLLGFLNVMIVDITL